MRSCKGNFRKFPFAIIHKNQRLQNQAIVKIGNVNYSQIAPIRNY